MSVLGAWAKANWLLLLILVFIIGAFVLLRTRPSPVSSTDELSRLVRAGRPTVIEFYSNF
jgi:hypothetical protein